MSKDRVILERRFVPKGSVIIKQGDDGYSAFLVQSGRLRVYQKHNDREIEIAELGVGEICGEMALLGDTVRSASVKALEDCNLIVITKASFEDKLKSSDTTIQAVVRMLIDRVLYANKERFMKQTNSDVLRQSVLDTYENMRGEMNEADARKFDKKVKPRLDDLMLALEQFSS